MTDKPQTTATEQSVEDITIQATPDCERLNEILVSLQFISHPVNVVKDLATEARTILLRTPDPLKVIEALRDALKPFDNVFFKDSRSTGFRIMEPIGNHSEIYKNIAQALALAEDYLRGKEG